MMTMMILLLLIKNNDDDDGGGGDGDEGDDDDDDGVERRNSICFTTSSMNFLQHVREWINCSAVMVELAPWHSAVQLLTIGVRTASMDDIVTLS